VRYEQMTEDQQEKMLARLYKRLNKTLFDGKLEARPIWIVEEIDWVSDGEAWAAFSAEKQRFFFSSVINEDIKRLKKKDQIFFLSCLMVHEMVHQYCWFESIDDSGHNEVFRKVAEDHGLKFEFVDGEWKQKGSFVIYAATCNFRF